jgi:hypothetical protein
MNRIIHLSRLILQYALLALGLDEFLMFIDVPPRVCVVALATRNHHDAENITPETL